MDDDRVEAIADLFQNHRDELGFVNRAQVREKYCYHTMADGDVAGAVICNHCVRKPQTTIYEIAVSEEHRREGIGEELVEEVAADSPHGKIIAKCPTTLPSNHFYRETGWQLIDVEDGKSRSLCVWRYDI